MNGNVRSPFDKEPAEGSRETVDRQLENESRKTKSKSHPPGSRDTDGLHGGKAGSREEKS